MRHRSLLSVPLAVLATLSALPAVASADQPSGRVEAHSEHTAQDIGGLRLTRAGHAVRATFDVALPAIGRGAGTDRVRLDVWDAAHRAKLASIDRDTRVPRSGDRDRVSVLITGSAARSLTEAGLGARGAALTRISVSSAHARQLDGDAAMDHTMLVVESGREAAQPLRRTTALAAGNSVDLAIRNDSSKGVALTTTPLTCVYDKGPSGDAYSNGNAERYAGSSNLSALNGLTVAGGGALTVRQYVENNARTAFWGGQQVNDTYGGTISAGAGQKVNDNADQYLRSPELRGLIAVAMQYYWGTGATQRLFPNAVADLPSGILPCDIARSLFAVAADQFARGNSGPTGPHAEATFNIAGDGKIEKRVDLTAQRLDLSVDPDHRDTLVVADSSRTSAGGFERWMEAKFPPGSQAASTRKLSDLQLPGSHDSGTAPLSVGMDWVRPNDRCSDANWVMDVGTGVSQSMAVTQNDMLRDQLDKGIRYLDMRVGWDGRSQGRSGQRFRAVHTIYSLSSLRSELQSIANWAGAHPNELVILDFNHLCTNGHGADFIEDLKSKDPVSGTSVCDRAYQTDPAQLTSTTLQQFRDSDRNIVVLIDKGDSASDVPTGTCGVMRESDKDDGSAAAGQVATSSLWPNEPGPAICEGAVPSRTVYDMALQATAKKITDYPSAKLDAYRTLSPTPLMITQTQLTLSSTSQIVGTVGCGLIGYQEPYASRYRKGVIAAWGKRANVIIGDAVNEDFVRDIVALNTA
jgi:hypothetical protein